MEDGADHLVHDVLPRVPVRQWVFSFPRRLRFRTARDPAVASRLLDLSTRALFAWQRRRARRLGAAEPRTAGVTAVQRFGSAISLNVQFHSLIPDEVVDLSGDGPACFVPLKAPSDDEVAPSAPEGGPGPLRDPRRRLECRPGRASRHGVRAQAPPRSG
jgi:hypothetical protein